MTPITRDFKATPEELSALKHLSKEWSGEFWSVDEILKTTGKNPYFFRYMTDGLKDQNWKAFIFALEQPDAFEILFIYTSPEFRGKGFGKFLLQGLKNAAEESNRKVLLEVKSSNKAAIALYESSGFHEILVRPGYYRDGTDALIYEFK